jgi:hypothetical protein
VIADRPPPCRIAQEAQVLFRVEADRELVVAVRAQPSITRTVVVFDAAAFVRVIGIAVAAALKAGARR